MAKTTRTTTRTSDEKGGEKPVKPAAAKGAAKSAGKTAASPAKKAPGKSAPKAATTTSAKPKAAAAKSDPKASTKKPAAAKAGAGGPASPKTSSAGTSTAKSPAKPATKTASAKAASVKSAAKSDTKSGPAKAPARTAKAAKAPTATARSAGEEATGKTAKAAPKSKTAAKAKPAAARKSNAAAAKAKTPAKPWLASYPEGIAHEIAPLEDESLGALLVKACQSFRSRPAFTCMDKSITYGELETLSAQFAAYLQSKGLTKGSRVAIMMPNVLQYPVAMMAVLRAGYTVVNVNPLYTPRELEHQLNDSGAEAIVILENFAKTLQSVLHKTSVKHVVVASMGDMLGAVKGTIVNLVVRRVRKMVPAWTIPGHVTFNKALKSGAGKTFRKPDVRPDDVAFLQYTGGTTGVSKGACLLHRNVLSNVAQNALWVEALFQKKQRPDQLTYVCALPLYHIFALTVNAMMGMQQGGHNILIPNPRDIPAFVKELKKRPFHIFPGLNTLFNALLNNDDFRKLDFKPLMLTIGGGMAVQKAVADRWKDLTGTVICEGYGLSETAPVATANRFDAESFTGTIGLPIPSTDIVVRDDDGKDMPFGEVGEICIRGPQVMAGYWNREDETRKVMTRDGYFLSGDMGFIDDKGFVTIVDRKKDMILVSGFNVYPNEIEDVVAQHPGIMEVAAVGVPDEKSGEVPKIFVVRKDDALTADEVIEFTRDKLTAYKRPRHVEFRSELPKTNVGKILRRELR